MRSLILLILGVSLASAGGYYYRDDIPTRYKVWEAAPVVKLQSTIIERIQATLVDKADLAVLEPIIEDAPELRPLTPTLQNDSQADRSEHLFELEEPVIAIEESIIAEHVEKVANDARDYINDLSMVQAETVPVKKADHFVGADQLLELLEDDAFIELVEPLSSKPIVQALAPRTRSVISKLDTGPDHQLTKELVLLQTSATTNLQPLMSIELVDEQNTDEPVMIVREANVKMPILPELVQVKTVTKPSLTTSQTEQKPSPKITIADLLKDEEPAKAGSIYYVRTVKQNDGQGIWGIIVDGLTENFANGIAISRDESLNTYQVNIPRQSDDMLTNNTSSFLGKLIDRKTRECFVYNFVEKKIGRNPDLIYPGQELLIINFEAEELIEIYTHFVENG